ncbi:MAG: helix-turn-helix domain-containing protein [Clostridia bacterium]|nr:helix-turn-helix domain-containing protein [Clostridia bacterium]
MDMKQMLGMRLRNFRVENGYSQNHIANILGVERSTYTYYETGKTVPVIFDLMRLADLYHTTLDDLMGFRADSSDPLAFHENRAPVKAAVRKRRKENYLDEAVQDLSAEERQLLAYHRSASPEERRHILEYLQNSRKKDHKRTL